MWLTATRRAVVAHLPQQRTRFGVLSLAGARQELSLARGGQPLVAALAGDQRAAGAADAAAAGALQIRDDRAARRSLARDVVGVFAAGVGVAAMATHGQKRQHARVDEALLRQEMREDGARGRVALRTCVFPQ